MDTKKHPVVERREEAPEQSIWWFKLSLAQRFSASSLEKFGYELNLFRNEQGHNLAVLTCNSGVAVITEDGDINTSPNINIR
jgi:hypothetical protein